MSSPVNLGLIGAGARLRGIVRRVLGHDSQIRVVSAYDPFTPSHAELGKMLGYDYTVAETEEAVVSDPAVDWVFIGSWNAHHARQAIAALEAGKNVFCEKPLAISLTECLAIRDAAARSGKTFAFGLVLRYSPHYQKLRQLLDEGRIGKLISFEFNETLAFNHGGYIFGNWRRKRENAGTHLLEKCCHDIDLANWLTGSLPVQVASFGGRDIFVPENAGEVARIGNHPTEGATPFTSWPDPQRVDPFGEGSDIFDNQVAILQYANGVRGTFHTNTCAGITERRFYLCGTRGAIRADLYTGVIEVRPIGWNEPSEVYSTNDGDGHGGGDTVMAKALAATLTKGTAPLTSVGHGLRSAIACFGIDQAVDEGRVVDLRPLWEKAGINPACEA